VSTFSLIAVGNHLWQSTLFAVLAGGLTLLMRRNSARVRYGLWLAASVKFLVPFAVLTVIGAAWFTGPSHAEPPALALIASRITAPMSPLGTAGPPVAATQVAVRAGSGEGLRVVLGVIWGLGALAVGCRWLNRWLQLRRVRLESSATRLAFVIPVRSSLSMPEPAVVGVLKPVLLIPQGLEQRLTRAELHGVLAHERCHVAWRDNLAASLHMLAEVLFWFHPLIWWLGARLVEERERACDERVLADGHAPESYAEGILKVCERSLASRLACVSGISGASLRARIEAIVQNRHVERLGTVRKALLAVVAGTAVAAPVLTGALAAPAAHAQAGTQSAAEVGYRNVSIQLKPDGGSTTFSAQHPRGRSGMSGSLRQFIAVAYGVALAQVTGRQWSTEPAYDITAEGPELGPEVQFDKQFRPWLRDLLEKSLGLVVRKERGQLDGYVLRVDPGSSSLRHEGEISGAKPDVFRWHDNVDSILYMTDVPISALAQELSGLLGVPVVDQTGLHGSYSYKVTWNVGTHPDPALLAKALEEQLGLRLEAGPVTVDVIDVVSLKPSQEVVTKEGTSR
jgi:uncharacterized protein (TIGR03435 family)